MILSLACDTILILSQEALFCYPHHFRLLYSPQHSWGIRLFIYITDSNIEHMKTFHSDDFAQYGSELNNIIANPDYVGKNAKDDSIEFTKEYYINGEYVKVAVRIFTHNIYYARSMYVLKTARRILVTSVMS